MEANELTELPHFPAGGMIDLKTNTVIINTLQRYDCFEYDVDGLSTAHGFYLLEHSDLINNPDKYHFHMAYLDSSLDIICASFELVSRLKARSAAEALVAYLGR